jgi:hypothetical protein
MGSEPLHLHLRGLESGSGSSGSSTSGPSKEQQTSCASKWASLTAAAREKLARLSERFKKDALHHADIDGGGSYASMGSGGEAPARGESSSNNHGAVHMNDGELSGGSGGDGWERRLRVFNVRLYSRFSTASTAWS